MPENGLNRLNYPSYCQVSNHAAIDPSAIIGPDSMSIIIGIKTGRLIQIPHEGMVVIEDDVMVGPLSVVHRASRENDKTRICKGTHIGSMVNVGHNSFIGKNCAIVSGTNIGGSCVIGDDVWIGMSVAIRPHINICDHAVIGIGSVVTKHIIEPGVYAGNPVRYIKSRGEGKPL